MADIKQVQSINQRVWYVQGGVHPLRSPQFLALGKFSGDPKITLGEEKKVSAPDPNNFNRDIMIGSIAGEKERATFSIAVRTTTQRSILLDWKAQNCRVDIFALSGRCGNPQDFSEGGEFWVYFPDSKLSNHAYQNFGAYGLDENKPTEESVDMTAEDYYQYLYMRQDVIGSASTVREITSIDVFAGDTCDTCTDQYTKVIMTMAGTGATPGTLPSILYSADAGLTWTQQNISTLFSTENVTDSHIIGTTLVTISNSANEVHWTDINELYEGTNQWNQVNSGFVAGKNVNAVWSPDVRHTWIVGNGGYIYFMNNIKVGAVVQDAGVATSQNLNSVHAMDAQNVLAVGNSNAVVYTANGGSTWESVIGPSVGVNLGACWMWKSSVWFVGEGSGGSGRLWVTVNSGATWTQIGLPNVYNRIDKIIFVSEAEGYISARAGGQSYILRTITAGNEWVVLPQGKKGTALSNQYLRDIAVTGKANNTIYAAGLATSGSAGVAMMMRG